MRTDLTTIQVKAVVTHLRDLLGEEPDEQLLLDSLEGETDLNELVSRLLGKIETADGMAAMLKDQIVDRKVRIERFKRQSESYRAGIQALMEAATLDKLPLPEATVTLRDLKDKLTVASDAVPSAYLKTAIVQKPDMEAIKEDFEGAAGPLPNWLTRETGRRSLTIRRK